MLFFLPIRGGKRFDNGFSEDCDPSFLLVKAETKAKKVETVKKSKLEKAEQKFTDDMNAMDVSERLTLSVVNNNLTIKQVLDMLDNGTIRVPALQRGCVWTNEQIAKLYHSFACGYVVPQIVVCNNELIDGLQRISAIRKIVGFLNAKNREEFLTKTLGVMQITGKLTAKQSVQLFDKLNSGTAMSKAVKIRNTMQEDTLNVFNSIKAGKAIQAIVNYASTQACNLDKQGQRETLTTYAIALAKSAKAIDVDISNNKAIVSANEYTEGDIIAIERALGVVVKVLDILESERKAGNFVANVYSLNTLSSILLASKLGVNAEKISENILKMYKNTEGKPVTANQKEEWKRSVNGGGGHASNVEIRAKLLIK